MANDSNKVLSVGNLKVLKDYIDKTGGTNRELISEEMKTYLDEELIKASNNLSKEYETEFKNLSERIAEVEASGTPEELAELRLELDALNNNFNDKNLALEALDADLKRLSGDFSTLYEGIETGSIFSAGQLNQVIKTALIDKTVITDDMVSTPNVFATQMVALIANMGHINAGSIDAGTIAGSNIESIHKIEGTNDPVWVINDEGDGWLAKKNIQWDKNGNVTFGPDVKITWDSVDGGDAALKGKLDEYDTGVKDYINQYVIDRTDNAVTQDQLDAAYKKASEDLKAVENIIYDNNAATDEKLNALETSITSASEALKLDYTKQVSDLQAAREAAEAGLQKAIEDGDAAMIAQYNNLKNQLDHEVQALYVQTGQINSAVNGLETTVNKMQEGMDQALTPDQLNELIATSLIKETELKSDVIRTPSLLATEIASLLGTFGSVTANDLTANTIEGFTISAPTAVRDADGYIVYNNEINPDTGIPEPVSIKRKPAAWQLNYDGSGWVGKGLDENNQYREGTGITWDESGNIEFGSNVKISWENNVDGGKEALNAKEQAITEAYEGAVGTAKTELTTALNNAKTALGTDISDAEKRAKDEAAAKAAELSKSLGELEESVENLKLTSGGDITGLTEKFNAWADDTKLSPIELSSLKEDKDKINTEYTDLINKISELNTDLENWAVKVSNKEIASELTADEIRKLQIRENPTEGYANYKPLTDAKVAIDELYTYYSSTAKPDSYGCVELSADYPLSRISAYYVLQNEYVLKYQEVATEYITNARFGSKTTWIGPNGIYSGTISTDKLIGTFIKGKTITDANESSFTLDADGTFTLGQDAIWYDGFDLHISGDNVYIDGDVSINGQAVMTGIKGDSTALSQFNDMVAAKIDATEISTEILETKPDENKDKIHIEDNYIYCINDEGDKNLIISSNALDTEFIETILATDDQDSYNITVAYITDCTITDTGNGTSINTDTSSIPYNYTNSSEWVSNLGKVREIGYLFKGSSLSVCPNFQGILTSTANFNVNMASAVTAADWLINGYMYIDLYKYNNTTESWELQSTKYAVPKMSPFNTSNWEDVINPYQSVTSGVARYKRLKGTLSFSISSNGKYGLVCRFAKHAICAKTASTLRSLLHQYDTIITNNDPPATYTEIGKDGIVTYDGMNAFKLTSDGVEMRAKTSKTSNNFYGIKVTSKGMYIGNGGGSWLKWEPTGYGTSSGTWT